MNKISSYQIIWHTSDQHGSIHLHLENGEHHHLDLKSSPESLLLLQTLRSEKPLYYDAEHRLILSELEGVAEGAYKKEADQLEKIEGIGPKIRSVLNEAGISTFTQLSRRVPEELDELLANAGKNFNTADPSTWPMQAEMAASGRWEELKAWQDELDGGKEK